MKLLYSIFLVLFIFVYFIPKGSAQQRQLVITPGMQYDYATALFDKKDYETAMVEYKRFIYFFPEAARIEQAEFNIAACLFYLKRYSQAARKFNHIIMAGKEDALTREAYFFQTRAFMNIGNTGYAQIVLQNYLKLAKDRTIRDRIYFNLAKIYLVLARKGRKDSLVTAQKYFLKISGPGAEKYHIDQYLDLILKARNAPGKNPGAAGLFAIIPGGGFLYCERYHDALVTFLLNAGLMAAAYKAYDNDNKPLAGVIGFVETGFYTGNIYGSVSCAYKYNLAQTIQILNREISIHPTINPEKKDYGLSLNYRF